MVFTEILLNSAIPNSVIELEGCNIYGADRMAADSGKSKGGGVCPYVNRSWCSDAVTTKSHCSADIEYIFIKCRPLYMPGEFTTAIITVVYLPLDANAKLAMTELSSAVNKLTHPDGVFNTAGYFNYANLRTTLPKCYQKCFLPHKRRRYSIMFIQTSLM